MERQIETLTCCSTYLCTHNLGISGRHSNQPSCLARAGLFTFMGQGYGLALAEIRGLHPSLEAGHTHTHIHTHTHTHTHGRKDREQDKGAPPGNNGRAQSGQLYEGQRRTSSHLWILLSPGPLFLESLPSGLWGSTMSCAPGGPRASGLPHYVPCCREGSASGEARPGGPVGTVVGIWAPTQTISVLAGRAGLLCGTSLPSLWLLGSPGSLPGHAVPIRALGPEEIC